MKYTRHLIPEEVLNKLKDTEAKIISGEIDIESYLEQYKK